VGPRALVVPRDSGGISNSLCVRREIRLVAHGPTRNLKSDRNRSDGQRFKLRGGCAAGWPGCGAKSSFEIERLGQIVRRRRRSRQRNLIGLLTAGRPERGIGGVSQASVKMPRHKSNPLNPRQHQSRTIRSGLKANGRRERADRRR